MAQWKGLDKALARMARLPAEVKESVQQQLHKEAEDLVAAMKRAAPVKSGVLRDTITFKPGSRPLSVNILAGGPATTVKVRKGVDDASFAKASAAAEAKGGPVNRGEFDYFRPQEFGHLTTKGVFVPAHPFFYPTYRARKRGLKRRLAAAARKPLKTLFPG